MDDFIKDDRQLKLAKEGETEIALVESSHPEIQALARYLPEELKTTWKITKDTEKKILASMKKMRGGAIEQLPMVCKGPACPMARNCFLLAMSAAPIGESCPIEGQMIEWMREQYAKDLNVSTESILQMDQVNDLIETIILDTRLKAHMAEKGWMQDVVVAMSPEGEPITRIEPSASYVVMMQQKRRKDSLMKQFIATRESQVKSGLLTKADPSSYASDLLKKVQALKDRQHAEAVVIEDVEQDPKVAGDQETPQ